MNKFCLHALSLLLVLHSRQSDGQIQWLQTEGLLWV